MKVSGPGPEPARVVCGPTRFHGVNERATAAREALPADVRKEFGISGLSGLDGHRLVREALDELGFADVDVYNADVWTTWQPGFAVPLCRMVAPGPAIPIAAALARGLSWSRECAIKLGMVVDDRNPLERVNWSCSRRAYTHVLDCATCWHVGVGSCEIFELIAKGEIVSDVDPRLDDLLPDQVAA